MSSSVISTGLGGMIVPPVSQVVVLSVEITDEFTAVWTFSDTITSPPYDGDPLWAIDHMQVLVGENWNSLTVGGYDGNQITTICGEPIGAATQWRITDQVNGLAFTSGLPIQTGSGEAIPLPG